MDFKTIRRSSAPEMVAEQILKQIETGELAPGCQLPAQRELAQQLGVGRSSLREATNALVATGYLEVIQGNGTEAANSMREHLRAVSAELKDRIYPAGDTDRPEAGEKLR